MPATGRKPSAKPGKVAIQSLLFPKSKFTPERAKAWAKSHGFYASGIETTEEYHRIRQYDPEHFSRMRTKAMPGGSGVKAVYGVVKG